MRLTAWVKSAPHLGWAGSVLTQNSYVKLACGRENTLNHHVFIYKLYKINSSDQTILWFKSYISDCE